MNPLNYHANQPERKLRGRLYLLNPGIPMPTEPQTAYQLKITLCGAKPPTWRRLLIEPGTTFQDLHRIIQVAMGWQASHLHLFQQKTAP
jgi:Plasmid pRiA4b ORF-3-like protein